MASVLVGNLVYENLLSYLVMLVAFIPAWVFLVLGWQIFSGDSLSSSNNENNLVEWGWTFIPTFMVFYLCVLNLLCVSSDIPVHAEGVVKVVGRQWLWSYDVSDEGGLYDSIMTDFVDSVDKPLRLKLGSYYRLVVTSSDVIHSFTLPELNLKVDAIPGRLNQGVLYAGHLGCFVGYCSELCGAGHAYMPIVLEVIPSEKNL